MRPQRRTHLPPALAIHFSEINNLACHADLEVQISKQIRRIVIQVLSSNDTPALHIKLETVQPEELYTEISRQGAAVCKKILGYRPVVTVVIHNS